MNAFIFICGCGHSGTTLMANMFAAHPEVYIPLRETGVFRNGTRDEIMARWEALREEGEASGKPYMAEKTPKHVRRIGLIRQLVPGARFLVPVRDGRDVAASYAKRTGDPQQGVGQWIRSNTVAVREAERADDVLIYRHEDLIDDPQGTLEQLCEFAGIPYHADMLNYHTKERLWFGQHRSSAERHREASNAKRRNWQVNQPIFDNRGQWTKVISPDDFGPLLEGAGERLMARFGYLEERAAQR